MACVDNYMYGTSITHTRAPAAGRRPCSQTRHTTDGTRPYYAAASQSSSFASIHNHANNIRTVGMGEVTVVMNGVEFRTRHNDYALKMPSTTSTDFQVRSVCLFVFASFFLHFFFITNTTCVWLN